MQAIQDKFLEERFFSHPNQLHSIAVCLSQAQFLAYLLMLLARRLCFCLVVDLAISLTVGFAISGMSLINKKVAIGFLE